MTTYSTISNALLAIGAAARSSTVTALRDNTLALMEGDTTLPQFPAGGLLLLDSQEPLTDTSTVTFDPTDLSGYNLLIVFASYQGSSNGSLDVDVRPTSGTWRTVSRAGNAAGVNTRRNEIHFIGNANNHGGGAAGNGNIVFGIGIVGSDASGTGMSRTDSQRDSAGSTANVSGQGLHTFADAVDEIRVTSPGTISGTTEDDRGMFLLYGVRSGTIEGTQA